MAHTVTREDFTSIGELLETLNGRPNNRFMRSEHASDKEDASFSNCGSLQEAEDLLRYGYTEKLGKVKEETRKHSQQLYNLFKTKRLPANMPVGFVPNVPNALQNRPDSMITIQQTFQKKKTKHVIYVNSSNCGTSTSTFVKAGIALVTAINLIEAAGIQTKLTNAFFSADSHDDETTFATLRIKDYGERFNLEKICFPMIHPAMFRRIGFKWLETCPSLKTDFSCGYGHTPDPSSREAIDRIYKKDDAVILWVNDIRDNDYSTKWILDQFGFVIPDKVRMV